MTRETKVGLVVGTGIILLIGIVVSDHLSSQQRGQQQTAAPPGYTDLANGQPRAINPQGVRPLVDAGTPAHDNRGVLPLPPANYDRHGNIVAPRGPTEQLGLNNVNPGGNANLTDRNPQGNPVAPGNPGSNAVADANITRNNGLPANIAEELRRNNLLPEDNTPRLTNPTGAVANGNAGGATTLGNPSTGVRPTEPLIHHVAAGESLWAIAQKFYGDGKYYTEIAKANADKLLADGGVREGVRLVIPNKVLAIPAPTDRRQPESTGAGNPGAVVVNGNAAERPDGANTSAANTGAANLRPAMRTIKVESGDSLSAISSRTLGSIRHMQLIIDANKDQIQDADDIKAGMTLRIPDLPAPPAPSTVTPRAGGTVSPLIPTLPGATPASPGTPGNLTPTTPRTPGAPGTPTTPGNTTPAPGGTSSPTVVAKVHKVQPRDTFSSIARARLGSDRRWREIFELNKDKVVSPDALREGIVLVLPADARQ